MYVVARAAGEQWRSGLIPLSIDGLVVAASMVLLTRRRAGLSGKDCHGVPWPTGLTPLMSWPASLAATPTSAYTSWPRTRQICGPRAAVGFWSATRMRSRDISVNCWIGKADAAGRGGPAGGRPAHHQGQRRALVQGARAAREGSDLVIVYTGGTCDLFYAGPCSCLANAASCPARTARASWHPRGRHTHTQPPPHPARRRLPGDELCTVSRYPTRRACTEPTRMRLQPVQTRQLRAVAAVIGYRDAGDGHEAALRRLGVTLGFARRQSRPYLARKVDGAGSFGCWVRRAPRIGL
jgi:hypothetical protein